MNARPEAAWLVPTGRGLMYEEQDILQPIPAATEIFITPPIWTIGSYVIRVSFMEICSNRSR